MSCRVDRNKNATVTVQEDPLASGPSQGQYPLVNPSDSGVIQLNLVAGRGTVQTRKEQDQTIYFEFISTGYNRVTAHLSSSDTLANLRFSQIFLPDGTMDGPFGRDLSYPLTGDGVYRISVHENIMAGDPWAGIFNVDGQLE